MSIMEGVFVCLASSLPTFAGNTPSPFIGMLAAANLSKSGVDARPNDRAIGLFPYVFHPARFVSRVSQDGSDVPTERPRIFIQEIRKSGIPFLEFLSF
jgi:hypothetical protein